MLTAVWVAVVAAAVAFVAGVGVAVYVMLKAARLMSETSVAVAGLRERGDLLIERANAAIDQAGEQIARTETVTASMEGVTAAMAQMSGRLTATAPARPAATGEGTSGPLTWAAALVYGVRWALGARRPGCTRPAGQASPGRATPGHGDAAGPGGPAARPARAADRRGRKAAAPPPARQPRPPQGGTRQPQGGRAGQPGVAALASRGNGTTR